jgi:hypothetical protein
VVFEWKKIKFNNLIIKILIKIKGRIQLWYNKTSLIMMVQIIIEINNNFHKVKKNIKIGLWMKEFSIIINFLIMMPIMKR